MAELSRLPPSPRLSAMTPPPAGGRRYSPFLLIACFSAASAYAADESARELSSPFAPDAKPIYSDKEPVLLEASEMEYLQEQSTVIASGKVAVTQGDTVVLADSLSYDQNKNLVVARGNVSMLEPSGNVLFADTLELKDDMKAGVIREFRARLSDNSLLAARGARKLDENRMELFKAVYSPCLITCNKDKSSNNPQWQVKANRVLVDDLDQTVTYDDAWMEVYGLPVLYSPYFSHPTPNADNQSGLLAPEYKHSDNLGSVVKIPVYFALSPDKDVTITPIVTSMEGLVMAGEYRQMLDTGNFAFDGSITQPKDRDALGTRSSGKEIRGHINGKGKFYVGEDYDWGFDIHRATDDTYLRRYNFSNDTLLTSKIYAEGFRFGGYERSYATIRGLAFQGLTQQDDKDRIPLITPLVDFNFESDPGKYNSRVFVTGGAMALTRDTGAQSRRVSSTAGLRLPYITDDGQIIEFEAQVRGDVYSVSDVLLEDGRNYDGTTGRLVPQASVTWRYPFINRGQSGSLMIEPIVNFTASPSGSNPEKIPNEDSLVPEFTDTNLFAKNRFAGYDRIEDGPRMSYGMRGQAQFYEDKYVDWMFGQHYRVGNDRDFPFSNELASHFSDYVGKVGLTYQPFGIAYRFRLDKDEFTPKRSEVDGYFNMYPVSAYVSYLSLTNDPILSTKEEIYGGTSINLSKKWILSLQGRQDLELDQVTSTSAGLTYANECTNIVTTIGREYTQDRDIKSSTTFLVRVMLKNLN